jgi:hypothetical protein
LATLLLLDGCAKVQTPTSSGVPPGPFLNRPVDSLLAGKLPE